MITEVASEVLPWQKPLDLKDKDVKILGSSHHVLFSCQEPGVPFRWVVMVVSTGQIYAVKALPIIIPSTAVVTGDFLETIRNAGPQNCKTMFVHEVRPYPALVTDHPGDTLRELPGGLVEGSDITLPGAATRELKQEFGIDPTVVGEMCLLKVPTPCSGGAQIEGYSIHALMFFDGEQPAPPSDEPIQKVEVVPLPMAYGSLLAKHESMEACTEFKTLTALLMLQQRYLERFGERIF
ncbi:MAG TPA: NUDIX domain-containing protein [Candidatus Paceibacterota bacterium]|nr:NUDIX domain-containing protein [Candidatus Paceibacterota bacterium]